MKSRFKPTKKALIFWCLFIGIGAVAGATGMLSDPTGKAMGMDAMLPYFQVLPFADIVFQNFIFSGFALLIVNGLSNLTAAFLMFRKKYTGIVLGEIFGITLMLWICIQFYIFPMNFMSTIYFIFGFIQAITGYAARVFYKQEEFAENEKDKKYSNIGTNKKELVVLFSRMGYTRKIAYELAEKTGADIYEVKSTELTEGTAGFWWCGRFGMHKWAMPIKDIDIDLSQYEKVTICSPIWVFNLCSPMRRFCELAAGKIKNVDCVLVHYQKMKYENAVKEIEEKLEINCKKVLSICYRKGNEIKRYEIR